MKRKINSIDILIAIGVIVLLIGAYMYLSRNDTDDSFTISSDHRITFMVEADKLLPGMGAKIAVGDQLVANGSYQDAYVTDVSVSEFKMTIANKGALAVVSNPTREIVRVTIEARVNKYGPYRDLSGQEIKAGLGYWLKTDDVVTLANIVKIIEEEN